MLILLATWKVLAKADRTPERDPEDTGFGAVFLKILLPAFLVGIGGLFPGQVLSAALDSLAPGRVRIPGRHDSGDHLLCAIGIDRT